MQSLFHGRRGPPTRRPANQSWWFANTAQRRSSLGVFARAPCSSGERARVFSNRGADFEQNAWHWRGLRKVGFLRAAESHAALIEFALKFNSMQTHIYRSGSQPRFKSVEGRLGQAPSAAGGGELAASENERPNPSIEGTSNIWLRQLSAAPHVKR